MARTAAMVHKPPLGRHIRVAIHETHELRNKINGLNKDIDQDNQKLTEDEQKLIGLEMQAVEAKGGKAPPLSTGQRRELAELRNRIGNLNKDIGRDTQRLSAEQTKLKAWQDQPTP
jgi:hypothetical protein